MLGRLLPSDARPTEHRAVKSRIDALLRWILPVAIKSMNWYATPGGMVRRAGRFFET